MDSLDKVSDDETQATEKRTPFDKGLDQIPYRFAYPGWDLTPSRDGRARIEPSPGRISKSRLAAQRSGSGAEGSGRSSERQS